MQIVVMVLLVLHVLPGVFWAGSTFVLARAGGAGAESLAYPQIGSATVSILAGAGLWGVLHRGSFGTFEEVLALGIACAIAAAGLQSARSLPSVRRLASARDAEISGLRGRIASAQRIAGALLAVTVVTMVIARYV